MQGKHMQALEFDKVLSLVAEFAVYEESRQQIFDLKPCTKLEDAKKQQKKTEVALSLIWRYGAPDMLPFEGLDTVFKKVERFGVAALNELVGVRQLLKTTQNLKSWQANFDVAEGEELGALLGNLAELGELRKKLERAIVSKEELSDNASDELFRIRTEIRQASTRIKEDLGEIVKGPGAKKYLQESLVTVKNGRFVLPVKAEHKTQVKGLVHGVSATGATLFVEPESVVEGNNKIRLLEVAEAQEVLRILKELSNAVWQNISALKNNLRLVLLLDTIFAKARYAKQTEATAPQLLVNGSIELKAARHPLINPQVVVPVDITMAPECASIVITGPNTGGKTVTLKTVGLFTLMAASGLLLPVQEGSCVSLFSKVLVDIGDEQSIEQNLSTFSGHITNLVQILKQADKNSLVLVDELGSGTDPVEGAGLAIAILNELKSKGAKVFATTHYAELKMYAVNTPGVCNASCEFDIETLKPTYKLILGLPGRSNAFEIAKRLGLEQRVIDDARNSIDESSLQFENMIFELNEIKKEMQEQIKLNDELKQELEAKQAILEAKSGEIAQKKAEMLAEFKAETEPIVELLEGLFKETTAEITKIKEHKDQEKLEDLRSRLKLEIGSKLGKIYSKSQNTAAKVGGHGFKKGDTVFVPSLQREAILTSNPGKDGLVSVKAGNISTKVDASRLEPCQAKHTGAAVRHKSSVKATKRAQTELHLRGMTVDEALGELDKFIDDAVMSGLHNVVVVHGKGTGVLRQAVHNYLKAAREVKSFRLGRYGEGEDGVTLVEL